MTGPILLLGASGQVGSHLRSKLSPLGAVIALPHDKLDLTRLDTLREAVLGVRPHWIINAAAYTAVDRAESEPDLAHLINADAVAILAGAAAEVGAGFVHYSTDYVFDGSGQVPFDEDSQVSPLNVYGASKAAGEAAIRAIHPRHLIFRTSWIYGNTGSNFFLTMLRLMNEQPNLEVVDDQIGAPTSAADIAEATVQGILQFDPTADAGAWGTYHMTNAGETSWFGFAEAILSGLHLENPPLLAPIAAEAYGAIARRPHNSRLSNRKLQDVLGITLPDWRVALARTMSV